MSGRVSHVAAGIANVIRIQPILTIRDGKLDLLERLAMVHVNEEAEARQLYAQFCQEMPCPEEVIYTELNPGLSVHSGDGMVGVAFVVTE